MADVVQFPSATRAMKAPTCPICHAVRVNGVMKHLRPQCTPDAIEHLRANVSQSASAVSEPRRSDRDNALFAADHRFISAVRRALNVENSDARKVELVRAALASLNETNGQISATYPLDEPKLIRSSEPRRSEDAETADAADIVSARMLAEHKASGTRHGVHTLARREAGRSSPRTEHRKTESASDQRGEPMSATEKSLVRINAETDPTYSPYCLRCATIIRMTRVDKSSPLWLAWVEYKKSEEYANSARWAIHPEHVEGSLWAAFVEGFNRRIPPQPAEPTGAKKEPRCPKCSKDAVL